MESSRSRDFDEVGDGGGVQRALDRLVGIDPNPEATVAPTHPERRAQQQQDQARSVELGAG
jgi:hypothetical protein